MSLAADILAKLISLPSVNPMGRHDCDPAICGEDRVSAFLVGWLARLGISSQVQRVALGRDNVIAFVPASGKTSATILWEVHQDTVPVDNMTVSPFEGVVREGRMYGRGACDVKGAMASMLAALKILVTSPCPRQCNLIVAFTVDEEHTFLGVQEFVGHLDEILPAGWARPWLAIVAEPTGLDLVVSHKGVVRWKIVVEGKACHSSMPWEGANAIYGAGQVVGALEELAGELLRGDRDPVLGSATLCVGMIRGGSAPNVVPDACELVVDRRLIPGETPEEATRQLHAALKGVLLPRSGINLRIEDPWLRCPPLPESVPPKHQDALLAVSRTRSPGAGARSVAFGTDASTLCQAGIPSLVFGPGSIDQAHTKDEWIEIDQLDKATDILVDWMGMPVPDDRDLEAKYKNHMPS